MRGNLAAYAVDPLEAGPDREPAHELATGLAFGSALVAVVLPSPTSLTAS